MTRSVYDDELLAAMDAEEACQKTISNPIAGYPHQRWSCSACGQRPTNKYAEGYPGKRYYGGCEHR